METIISQTKALSWQDLDLEPKPKIAKKSSKLIFVGKLVADKKLSKLAIHSSICVVWNFSQHFIMEDSEAKKFIFTFKSPQDKLKILRQAPWNFWGFLLILKRWSPGSTIQEISFQFTTFTIQIHGFLLDHIIIRNATNVGNALNKLVVIEEDPIFWVAWRN